MRRSFSRALAVIIAFGTWIGALSGAMATDTGLYGLRAAFSSRDVRATAGPDLMIEALALVPQ